MNTLSRTIVCIAASATLLLAQGRMGPGMNGPEQRDGVQNSSLAMTKIQTISGSVTAVGIGYGMQYPSITVNKLQVKVAPVWYLLDRNFEIKTGDNLSILAAPSTNPSDAYLYAIEITNASTKAHIVLRDPTGVPLWSQSGRGRGMSSTSGPIAGGDCREMQSIASATGLVEQITAGAGIQMPSVTLKDANGRLLTIKLGPERLWDQADVELKAGDTVTIKYAVVHDDELVAITVTKGGVTVALRGDDCRPAWE